MSALGGLLGIVVTLSGYLWDGVAGAALAGGGFVTGAVWVALAVRISGGRS